MDVRPGLANAPYERAQALLRQGLGSLGGVLLALSLFTLLALLVAPPEDDRPVVEMPVSVSMVEAPTPEPPAAAAAPATPSPPLSTPPPPPAPMPAPNLDSAIAIPTPETPPLEVSKVPLDTRLPELTAIEPEPKPEPEPEPQPESPPQPAPEPAQPAPSQALARTHAAPSEQPGGGAPSSAQGVIDSPQPTSRIPPEYPARAQRRGLEGYVEVRFTILPDGSVDSGSLRVIDARPRHTFERAAMRAISRWQFAESAGTREARQRLEFRLEG